jgi:hypothetical protein
MLGARSHCGRNNAGHVDELDEGIASVTMAYVLLIHLMVVCPLIRLMSISMKESAKRR